MAKLITVQELLEVAQKNPDAVIVFPHIDSRFSGIVLGPATSLEVKQMKDVSYYHGYGIREAGLKEDANLIIIS